MQRNGVARQLAADLMFLISGIQEASPLRQMMHCGSRNTSIPGSVESPPPGPFRNTRSLPRRCRLSPVRTVPCDSPNETPTKLAASRHLAVCRSFRSTLAMVHSVSLQDPTVPCGPSILIRQPSTGSQQPAISQAIRCRPAAGDTPRVLRLDLTEPCGSPSLAVSVG